MNRRKKLFALFFMLTGILFSQMLYSQEVKKGLLTIKEGISEIEEKAYEGRSDITKVVFPKSLKTINARAFANCTSLKQIVFSEGLNLIGYEAFLGCKNLSQVSLPESLDTILSRAFYDTAIRKVSLPKKIQNVESSSFPRKIVPNDIVIGHELKPVDVDLEFPTHKIPDEKFIVKKMDARIVNLDYQILVYVNPLDGNQGDDGYATATIDFPVIDRDYQFLVDVLGYGASRYEVATSSAGHQQIRVMVGPVPVSDGYLVILRFKVMNVPVEYNGYISDKFPKSYSDWEKFFLLPSGAAGGIYPDHPYFKEVASYWKTQTMSPPELGKRAFVYPWRHMKFSESCIPKDPPWALQIGMGDCTEFSGVFVSLSRALGIPARQISVITYDENLPRFVTGTNHSLAEVYMEPVGWFAVDANLGGGSLTGKNRFGHVPVHQVYMRPENSDYVSYPKLNGSQGSRLGYGINGGVHLSMCDAGEPHEILIRNVRKKNAVLAKNIPLPKRVPQMKNYTKKEALRNLNENLFQTGGYKPMEIGLYRLSPYEENHGAYSWYSEPDDSFHNKGKKVGEAKEGLIDGTMYIREGVWEIYAKEYFSNKGIKKLVIPSTVTKIDSFAFQNCSNLTEVEIPSSVKEIGEGAFQNCVQLKKIVLNEGLEKIGSMAFKNNAMAEISIPSSVKEIGDDCFGICSKLTVITVKKGSKAADSLKGDKRVVYK